jgi:hypothetical protein
MKIKGNIAVLIILFLFVLFFAVVLTSRWNFPALAISGEESPGTWMSGALLLISAGLSLSLSFRKAFPWIFIFLFFAILAVDERFMLHEQLKEHIIFNFKSDDRFIYELPVIAGACLGFVATFILFRELDAAGKVLLACAALLGVISVIIDVFEMGVLIEDSAKLIAELLVTIAIVKKSAKSIG